MAGNCRAKEEEGPEEEEDEYCVFTLLSPPSLPLY